MRLCVGVRIDGPFLPRVHSADYYRIALNGS
ncbi:hypothetical protein JMJ77_0002655 [Colletotrichum scovillei]|uniref:Uncharacterized protein n=1 Tax=Colletotrichum scovillei TaxID=1209932 RepID=A0A9P7R8B1_9PEZI|nr:hypothetical protein JMJ77_0002655 [Colletotrichum scovillei]KAG7071041.1 hypothetical protein JMJ76_0002281 [Colletotrichum scovillei]KAG7079353.1 hypothetical protein JMJ78_0003007 [Colletotrichum scovillei]